MNFRRRRRHDPVKITTRVMVDGKALASAVNEWNARSLAEASGEQIARFRRVQEAIRAGDNDPAQLRADAERLEAAAREKRRRADEIDGDGSAGLPLGL